MEFEDEEEFDEDLEDEDEEEIHTGEDLEAEEPEKPKKPRKTKVKYPLNADDQDRIIEVLVYLYFNNKAEVVLKNPSFWTSVKDICDIYHVEYIALAKCVRLLAFDENRPKEEEIYALLGYKLGVSTRNLKNMSGIYWQKQVKYKKTYEENPAKIPVSKRRILDPVQRKAMRDFVRVLYDWLGIFSYLDIKFLGSL